MERYEPSTCKTKRDERREFLEKLVPFRDDLFKYSRKLTNNPWDAEDLAQETLANAYTRLSDAHLGIENLKAYLFKMCTNLWIDWCRRAKLAERYEESKNESYTMGPVFEVKDSLSLLYYHLPPKERVAVVLKEVFDFSLDECATIMETSEGAIKVALHRGREKISKLQLKVSATENRTAKPEEKALVEKAVDFFNKRDLEGFSSLFIQNATANGFGCFLENGIDQIKKGSLFYTLNSYDGSPLAASFKGKVIELHGEYLFAIFNEGKLDDIWRFSYDHEEKKLARFDCYFCCPNVLEEIAALLKVTANSHGYYFEQNHNQITN